MTDCSSRLLLVLTLVLAAGCNWLDGGIPEPDRMIVEQLHAAAKSQSPPPQATPSDKTEVGDPIQPFPDWNLRQTAADALGRIGAPAVPNLVHGLKDHDPRRRQSAARVLARIGPAATAAVPALTEALQDPDPLVRKLAARALGQVGPDAAEAVPALMEMLHEE